METIIPILGSLVSILAAIIVTTKQLSEKLSNLSSKQEYTDEKLETGLKNLESKIDLKLENQATNLDMKLEAMRMDHDMRLRSVEEKLIRYQSYASREIPAQKPNRKAR